MSATLSIVGGLCELSGLAITVWQISGDYRTAESILDAKAGEWVRPSRSRYRHQRPGRPTVAGHTLEAELGNLNDEILDVADELENAIADGDNTLRTYIKQMLVGGIRVRMYGVGLVAVGIVLSSAGSALSG